MGHKNQQRKEGIQTFTHNPSKNAEQGRDRERGNLTQKQRQTNTKNDKEEKEKKKKVSK